MKRRLYAIISIYLMCSLLISAPAFAIDDPVEAANECEHSWSEWYTTVYPDCGNSGEESRNCSLCGEYESRTVPATGAHDWDEWEVTKAATIFRAGTKTRTCWYCGTTQSATINKISPFAKFKKKKYTPRVGKTLNLKAQVKMGKGDTIKSWKVSNKKVATISKSGKLKARKKGTVKVTVKLKSGKKATCTIKVKAKQKKKSSGTSGTVYWTPSGSVYHVSRHCPTLSRSKVVYSGSRSESGKSRCCKVCG